MRNIVSFLFDLPRALCAVKIGWLPSYVKESPPFPPARLSPPASFFSYSLLPACPAVPARTSQLTQVFATRKILDRETKSGRIAERIESVPSYTAIPKNSSSNGGLILFAKKSIQTHYSNWSWWNVYHISAGPGPLMCHFHIALQTYKVSFMTSKKGGVRGLFVGAAFSRSSTQ